MIYTDNKDFYPTPRELFDKLTAGERISGRILEPSAGKGDIIRHIREKYRHSNGFRIDAIENDHRLVDALIGAGITVVWDDFLTYETYKEYDFIVMNPPFSNGVDHVLKALELTENQLSRCEIYAILNKQTIDNAYSSKRQELLQKLDRYGAEIRYISGAFTEAERKTDVEVALIHVKVEKEGAGKSIYDRIPFINARKSEEMVAEIGSALSTYVKPSEIQAKLNDIERLVLEYETACELARSTFEAIRAKASFFGYISTVNKRVSGRTSPLYSITPHAKEFTTADLSEELDRLRRGYWELILDTDEFRKMLTADAIEKLNRRIETANEMEINLPNIRMLLMALGANQRDILIESVVSIFQKITDRHMTSYSSNVHYYNGWKTNSSYKINKKIVIPIKYSHFDSWDFRDDYERINYDVRRWIDDIIKALQLIDPNVSSQFTSISRQEFENDTLRFKMFAKGTIHVWFKDAKLLAQLNYICGSHFGWIPSNGEQDRDPEAREWVAREFGDLGEVILLQEAI
ncbi:hypothetical protein PghCCS26_47620 [Paenibacillus glycanilyticus]|uniref:DUF4942 domain-containing protein n=1 Tax=Paenibacillus glycanilyticus TaxID=126569 RepID=A0ABQ6NTT5_9BACL|nr:DUF4942 domain-containing protein [Paenibacillus glycanilyticus]GMK47632.1 hypothetical protein PghCCS26_47620 [Paenibacillus glycanilyticus]